jgi:Carboxypeptidase activation peptide
MLKCINILVICALLGGSWAAKFDNFRVFYVKVENESQLSLLQSLEGNEADYIFYDSPEHVNSFVDLLVAPHKHDEFAAMVEKYNLNVELTYSNFQA